MITQTQNTITALTAPIRTIYGQVKHYRGDTLIATYDRADALEELEIQRTFENSKFFGMVCCQRLHIKLIDIQRNISIQAGDKFEVRLNTYGETPTANYPYFYATETNRDERTNELSITAYDKMDTLKEINALYLLGHFEEQSSGSYSMANAAAFIASELGMNAEWRNLNAQDSRYTEQYTHGANFDESFSLYDILEDICEAMQVICFLTQTKLVLKAIRYTDTVDLEISRGQIIDLSSKTNRRLVGLCSATELGDNVTSALEIEGTTQYFYDNGFLELRTDLGSYLDEALGYCAGTSGYSVNQFEMEWRGFLGLELGDKISFVCKNGNTAYSYVFNDTITYNGTLKEETQYSFDEQEDTETNPSSLGEALNRTFARVDKAEQKITLLVQNEENNTQNVAQLQLTTDSITANLNQIRDNTENSISGLQADIQSISNALDAKLDANGVELIISETLNDGVESITTKTGYTFDEDGLTISKSDSEMETLIDEDGMTISRSGNEVLEVSNTGVIAENISIDRYLTIGTNSRIEDYGSSATAIYWIGGV